MAKVIIKTPYFGIEEGIQRPYSETEAKYFFGREKDTRTVKDLLRRGHCLTIISNAHAGKTSFLQAGLIHDLKENGLLARAGQNWRIAFFRPTDNPLEAFIKAVSKPGILYQNKVRPNFEEAVRQELTSTKNNDNGFIHLCESADTLKTNNLLLVLDDFGLCFKSKAPKKDKQKFFNLLINAVNAGNLPLYIIIVVNKMDLLSGGVSDYPNLLKLIRTNQYSLHPLQESELVQAIRNPAEKEGITVSDDFCEKAIEEIGDGPDKLRKLHRLMQATWFKFLGDTRQSTGIHANHFFQATGKKPALVKKKRKVNITEHETTDETIQVVAEERTEKKAVTAQMVNQIFAKLSDAQQLIAQRIFQLLLFKPDSNSSLKTRTIAPDAMTELLSINKKELVAITNQFSGVLEVSSAKIQVVSAKIVDKWDALAQWITEETNNITTYQKLTEATKKHYLESEPIETLFQKDELIQILKWDNEFRLVQQKNWAVFFNEQDYDLTCGLIERFREMLNMPVAKSNPKKKLQTIKQNTAAATKVVIEKKTPIKKRIKINSSNSKKEKEASANTSISSKRKKIVIRGISKK